MHCKTNASSALGDQGTLLEGVVDALYAIIFHLDKETRGHLWLGGSSVEQSGGGMDKPLLGQQIVSM